MNKKVSSESVVKEVRTMAESNYLTLLGKLEGSDEWGFGDAFQLIIDYAKHSGQAYSSDKAQWEKVYSPISDVWLAVTDAMCSEDIIIKSGKLEEVEAGPGLTNNSNKVVIDKISFLSWYSKNKNRISQYLSCANLKIEQEVFLDRLASIKQPSRGGRPKFPYTQQVEQVVKKLLERKPNIQQGKIPYMPEVVNSFAPGKGEEAHPNMPLKKYQEEFGWAVSTIAKIIAGVYKIRS